MSGGRAEEVRTVTDIISLLLSRQYNDRTSPHDVDGSALFGLVEADQSIIVNLYV